MRVLYHAERQAFPGHRDGIHERGQPPPPGIRIDLGQLHIGIGDAHQVIEERQVLRVCIANLGIDLRSGGMRVKTLDANSPHQASASGRNIIIVWCKPQWCTIFRTDLT